MQINIGAIHSIWLCVHKLSVSPIYLVVCSQLNVSPPPRISDFFCTPTRVSEFWFPPLRITVNVLLPLPLKNTWQPLPSPPPHDKMQEVFPPYKNEVLILLLFVYYYLFFIFDILYCPLQSLELSYFNIYYTNLLGFSI